MDSQTIFNIVAAIAMAIFFYLDYRADKKLKKMNKRF